MCVYIYIYIHICICICIHVIHVYIDRRERRPRLEVRGRKVLGKVCRCCIVGRSHLLGTRRALSSRIERSWHFTRRSAFLARRVVHDIALLFLLYVLAAQTV